MAAKVRQEGFGDVDGQLAGFIKTLKGALRYRLNKVAKTLARVTEEKFAAAGLERDTGTLLDTLEQFSGASSAKAWVGEITNVGDAFYAPWLEYGLAARPWHERAKLGHHKASRINPRLGQARDAPGARPWGLPPRPFFRPAIQALIPEFEAAVDQALDAAVARFNGPAK